MNGTPDNIIVNSCELTPIYLIQDSGVAQATSYVLTPASQVEQKPVSNLKRFYESSGNLEKSVLLNSGDNKPRILKKTEGSQIGNNLKLASFLVPKTSAPVGLNNSLIVQNSGPSVQSNATIVQNKPVQVVTKPVQPVNNVVLKPTIANVSAKPTLANVSAKPTIANVSAKPTIANVSAKPTVANVSVKPTIANVSAKPTIANVSAKPAVANVSTKHTAASVLVPSSNVELTVPKIDIDRKIVKLKPCDTASRHFHGRSIPKIKPKVEVAPELPKYTSVQLLKLGETYHSLNVLSDDQVKMVNQALNIIKDPEKIPTEPAYDPVTNTRFIYKIVSPKDLKVVGKNKVAMKEKQEPKREPRKLEPAHLEEEARVPLAAVITRSGRKVKLPKQMQPEEAPQKPRKRHGNIVTCIQCSADFGSLYQLQKHYEANPSHAPAKLHSNLFHCLLAIVTSSPAEARAKLLIQQLEQLVQKLRALLPCLLKAGEDDKPCSIGEDVSRLFGMNPGKYSLNIDALNCVKDKDGHCEHSPPPPKPSPVVNHFSADVNKPSQLWLSKHKEEIANVDAESDDCARINTVHKWPTVSNKLWNIKQKSQKNNIKKMRLASDTSESLIDLGRDDLATLGTDECAIPVPQKMTTLLKNENETEIPNEINDELEPISFEGTIKKSKGSHIQFHSAHFDIRSSPIKPSSTVFRKFQINPDKMEKLNVQIIRPLALEAKLEELNEITPTTSDCNKLDSIFRDEIEMTCKDVISNGISFDSTKNWAISSESNDQSHDSFMKSNTLIEPSLIHVKDDAMDTGVDYSIIQNADMPILNESDDHHENHDNRLSLSQSQSVLNFLENLGNECLTYPEPEIRNTSVDFHLDLFSFNNT